MSVISEAVPPMRPSPETEPAEVCSQWQQMWSHARALQMQVRELPRECAAENINSNNNNNNNKAKLVKLSVAFKHGPMAPPSLELSLQGCAPGVCRCGHMHELFYG